MSRIAGLVSLGGAPLSAHELRPMLSRLAICGAHDERIYAASGCSLGQLHLAADDEAGLGTLLADGALAIAADCRLDNRAELVEGLGLPANAGDSHILLAAYRRWGTNMTARLLGDFAFAIWDETARRLFAARDHFGVKPFYYAATAGMFGFASDPAALLAVNLVPRAVNEGWIAGFLAAVAPALDETGYVSLKRLPPGHECLVEAGDMRIASYWQLAPLQPRPCPGAPARLRDLLGQAVADRLRGGPAGAMLSGGLDSSSIACLASRLSRPAPLPVFSMVFDATPEMNERPFIEAVLAQGGFAPHFLASGDVPPFAELDQILDEQTDLFLAPNMACGRRLHHAAAAAGIRVLLDGHGGDEVAPLGFERLHELAAQGHWLSLWRQLDGDGRDTGRRSLRSYWRFLRHYSLVRLLRRPGRAKDGTRGDPSLALMNPEFVARTGVAARQRAERAGPERAATRDCAMHHAKLTGPLQVHAFELLDRAAAAAGVEARYPFWDKRLVEFCLSLPAEDKLKDGWGRYVLRRAMQDVLPAKIQWRTGKFSFAPHLAMAIARNHAPLVNEVLADRGGLLAPYLNLPALRQVFSRLCAEGVAANGWEVQMIWRVTILSRWLERAGASGAKAVAPQAAHG